MAYLVGGLPRARFTGPPGEFPPNCDAEWPWVERFYSCWATWLTFGGLSEAPKIDVGEVVFPGLLEADREAGRWMLFLEGQEMVNRDVHLGALSRWQTTTGLRRTCRNEGSWPCGTGSAGVVEIRVEVPTTALSWGAWAERGAVGRRSVFCLLFFWYRVRV